MEYEVIERGIVENRTGNYNGVEYNRDGDRYSCGMYIGDNFYEFYRFSINEESCTETSVIDVELYIDSADYRFQIDSFMSERELMVSIKNSLFNKHLLPHNVTNLMLRYIPKHNPFDDSTSLERAIKIYKEHKL